ncbi:MAG: enoyl-CoA hydratase/isomerase family protein, partial [Deltaproteobacteria bacterium]|nr:enoyl-CoA hydratase/isomerase family protein [Deltaproteobacteria bacterium]
MPTKSKEILLIKKQGAACFISLNRPERHNALSLELAKLLSQALKKLARDPKVRVLVLKGSNKAFSAGGDLKFFQQNLDSSHENFLKISKELNEAVKSIVTMPKPVIAAIQGPAYAAGFGLALSCDLLVASKKATLSPSFVNIALSGNASSTYFLPRIIGEKRAREAFLTGKAWTAQEALNLGLVSQVYPEKDFEKSLQKLVDQLSHAPTQTLARLKKVLLHTWGNSLATQLDLERKEIALSSTSQDFREGIQAFV